MPASDSEVKSALSHVARMTDRRDRVQTTSAGTVEGHIIQGTFQKTACGSTEFMVGTDGQVRRITRTNSPAPGSRKFLQPQSAVTVSVEVVSSEQIGSNDTILDKLENTVGCKNSI